MGNKRLRVRLGQLYFHPLAGGVEELRLGGSKDLNEGGPEMARGGSKP